MKTGHEAVHGGRHFRTRHHGHSVKWKTRRVDAQASSAGRSFRTRHRGRSVTRKTMGAAHGAGTAAAIFGSGTGPAASGAPGIWLRSRVRRRGAEGRRGRPAAGTGGPGGALVRQAGDGSVVRCRSPPRLSAARRLIQSYPRSFAMDPPRSWRRLTPSCHAPARLPGGCHESPCRCVSPRRRSRTSAPVLRSVFSALGQVARINHFCHFVGRCALALLSKNPLQRPDHRDAGDRQQHYHAHHPWCLQAGATASRQDAQDRAHGEAHERAADGDAHMTAVARSELLASLSAYSLCRPAPGTGLQHDARVHGIVTIDRRFVKCIEPSVISRTQPDGGPHNGRLLRTDREAILPAGNQLAPAAEPEASAGRC